MKRLLLGGIVALAVGMVANSATGQAAVITYALNEIIAGGAILIPTSSFGTVSFSDNISDPNKVDVNISLNGTGEKTLSFFFNYNDATFGSSTPFVLTGGVTTYINNNDSEQADGFTAGKFDIQTPATGNGGTEPLNFTIALAGHDLNPSDFNFMDSSGRLFDAVHIGNCGIIFCTPGANGDASIWVGAGSTVSVPEPASLLLLGSALLPFAWAKRRKTC